MTARGGWLRQPGRLIAVAALIVMVVGASLTAVRLVRHQAPPLDATNGVGIGAVIATLAQPGDELCLASTPVPRGTRAVQLWLGWHGQAAVALSGTLRLAGGESIPTRATAVPASAGYVTVPLATAVRSERVGVLCVTRGAGAGSLDVAGAAVIRGPGERAATVDGTSLGGVEPSLRMLSGQTWTSSASQIGAAVSRLARLSPAPLGVAGIIVALGILLPAGTALLLWNLATAPRRTRFRVAALCALGSLAITTAWATITPSFQGPDEPEHFAFAQHVAQTGRHPEIRRDVAGPGPYSTQLSATLALLRNNAVVIDRDARQPWTAHTRAAIDATAPLPSDDGGGFTESASGHSALYYALLAPAMRAAGTSIETQLWAARLLTACLAALIAGFAAWAAGIMAAGRARVAALAGLAAATVPMAGAVGGVVNNDTLVNLVAAAAFTVVVSLLAAPTGARWRFAAAGALLIALPLAKISGLGVAAAFAVATTVAGLRAGSVRGVVAAAATTIAGAAATAAVLAACATLLLDAQALTLLNVHPAVAGPSAPPIGYGAQLRYIVQTLAPPIHLAGVDLFPHTTPYEHVYLHGLWGGFGWGRLDPPATVFSLLRWAAVAGVIAGAAALVRGRALWAQRRLAVLLVAATPLVAISFVAYAYAATAPRPVYGEQGRYLLIALVPVALWIAATPGACAAGRLRSIATGVVAGTLCTMVMVSVVVAAGGWAT